MNKHIIGVLGIVMLSWGLMHAGATLGFLGEQIKKGAELAHETVVKGSEAVSQDISSGWETTRKGAEDVAKGVSTGVEAARDAAARGAQKVGDVVSQGAETVGKTVVTGAQAVGDAAAKGAEVIYQTTKPVVDAVVQGAETAGRTVASGAGAVASVAKEGAQKVGEVVAGGARIVYEGAKGGAEFIVETTRPVTDAAIAASDAFVSAVANALQSGLSAVGSGAEFVGQTISKGGKTVVKATGRTIQFVGDQLKQAGILVEEGAERGPEELKKLWDRSQLLINRALQEGLRRAKEVPKLTTGAAAVFIKNDLSNAVIVKTQAGDLIELSPREEAFAGAQLRIVFIKDQSAFVVYDSQGKELCTLHTGFDGDLLWVNVTSPSIPENVRAYVGGHNGAATYRIAPGLKIKIDWWLNSSKYFLHDFYFELLPA